jgi:hypothetical protein
MRAAPLATTLSVFTHRPIGFPWTSTRRRRQPRGAQELDLEFGAVVCRTNFQEGNHVLLIRRKTCMYGRPLIWP